MGLSLVDFAKTTTANQVLKIPYPLASNVMQIMWNNHIWETYKAQVSMIETHRYGHAVAPSIYQSIKEDLKRWDAKPYRLVDVNEELGYVKIREAAPWDLIVFETEGDLMEFILTWS
jgi:hypothetical protein